MLVSKGVYIICIAIYKPAHKELSEESLQNSWNANSDGAGFMYAEKKKLHIVKGLMTYEAFKTAYEPHKNKECVLHFRISTHGKVDEANTHPFSIDKNLGMVHNGIINKVACDVNKDMSDTWHFVEKFLKKFHAIYPQFWLEQEFKELIENYILGSKFILMDNEGNCDIYNESVGIWDCECWFSNSSYKTFAYQQPQPRKCYSKPKESSSVTYLDSPAYVDLKEGDIYKLKYQTYVDNPQVFQEVLEANTEVIIKKLLVNQILVACIATGRQTAVPLWKLGKITQKNTNISLLDKPDNELLVDNTFKVGEEVVFFKNYNHFRIGDTKKITLLTEKYVFVSDFAKQKQFPIPKDYIRPVNQLLM